MTPGFMLTRSLVLAEEKRVIGIGRRCSNEQAETLYAWSPGTDVTVAINAASVPEWVAPFIKPSLANACAAWRRVCNLSIDLVDDTASAHVLVTFGAIDGPGGVLGETEEPVDTEAHPQLVMDLDPDEPWTPEYLEDVMRHELGHALGVGHTTEAGNTMLAEYDGTVHRLGTWDVDQGVERYGQPVQSGVEHQRFSVTIHDPGDYVIDVISRGVLSLHVERAPAA